jgi:hypothetical protein
MRYAKSILRGGEIINASACDYKSTKLLGLVCPFCSQAVFFRSGSFYTRKDKQVISPDSFAHYHSDEPLAKDCELRSSRPEGEEYLQRLKIEAKNQRLSLFNERFWLIVKQSYGVTSLREVDKAFKKNWLQAMSIQCRRELKKNLGFYQTELEQLKRFSVAWQKDKLLSPAWTKEEAFQEYENYSYVDKQINLVIAKEALEFLSTPTSGYAFLKILKLAILYLSSSMYASAFREKATSQSISLFAKKIEALKCDDFLKAVAGTVFYTNWLSIFKELEDSHELNMTTHADEMRSSGNKRVV